MSTAVYFLALATARIVSLSRLDSGSRALEMITSRASRQARGWWSGAGRTADLPLPGQGVDGVRARRMSPP